MIIIIIIIRDIRLYLTGRGEGRESSSFVFKALITVDDLSSGIFLFSNEEIVKHGASVEYGNFCRCNE